MENISGRIFISITNYIPTIICTIGRKEELDDIDCICMNDDIYRLVRRP